VTQFPRVSRALYETETSFKSAVDAVAACLVTHLSVPLQEILFGPTPADLLSDERNAAAALFAIEYALASLLRECGVAPDCVTGKDAGALAAFCFAGACDLETAVAQLFSPPESLEISTAKVPVMPSVNAVIGGRLHTFD
jgi:acyl transferase domain-containing protein